MPTPRTREPAALGLDLGTTFSVVSQVNEAGLPTVLPNSEGSPTTPSVVLFDRDHVVVGAVARESLATEPENVVALVKRQMGSQWVFEYGGITYRPEHISALIVRKLQQDAQLLAGPARKLVITVPAYFNDTMRLATKRAGELAGAEVIGLLSEPTAAALAFGYQKRPSGTTGVVVDLGGGTFDVTVMDYDGHDLKVRATGGDAYLGGANFDKVIFDLLVSRFRDAHGLDINDPDALSLEEYTQVSQDWLARANRAKHDLTQRDHTMVALQVAGLTHRAEIRREQFLDGSRVLLEEISEKLIDVVSAAGIKPKDIGVVLAVGGSTRLPAVRERIAAVFGRAPDTTVRPDEAVALGAGLYAAQRQLGLGGRPALESGARDYLERLQVHDVAAHTLGVSVFDPSASGAGVAGHVMAPVLPRNTPLPRTVRRTFYTMRADETRVVVPILEGDDSDPELCQRIGVVTITDLPAGRPANQEVDVAMTLDRDGILHVAATDRASGAAATARIVHTHQPADGTGRADAAVRTLVVE